MSDAGRASTRSNVDFPLPLRPVTSRCSPGATSRRSRVSRPGTTRPRTATLPPTASDAAPSTSPEPAREPQWRRRSGHRVAQDPLDPLLRVSRPPGRRGLHPRPLEGVHELVVVARPPPVRDTTGAAARGLAQVGELVRLPGVVLLPAAPGGLARLAVRRVRAGPGSPTAPVDPTVPRVEVDDTGAGRVEQHPVVRRDEHRAPQVAQLRLEELQRRVVEVVGRLVEEQRRRPPHEQRRQREP